MLGYGCDVLHSFEIVLYVKERVHITPGLK